MTQDIDWQADAARATRRVWLMRASLLLAAVSLCTFLVLPESIRRFLPGGMNRLPVFVAALLTSSTGVLLSTSSAAVLAIRACPTDVPLPQLAETGDERPVDPWGRRRNARLMAFFIALVLGIPLVGFTPLALLLFLDVDVPVALPITPGLVFTASVVGWVALETARLRQLLASGNDRGIQRHMRLSTGTDSPVTRAHILSVQGRLDLARAEVRSAPRAFRGTDRAATVFLALAFKDGAVECEQAFRAIHHRAVHRPFGALGLSDVTLAKGIALDAAPRHALGLSYTRLWSPHLIPYAQANLARCLALAGDAEAVSALVSEVERDIADAPARRRAAVLHRLACAWSTLGSGEAQPLFDEAVALDPDGGIGQRIRDGHPPAPEWP